MDVIHKDATIANTDTDFPGSFEVVLSAPTLDRDGDTLKPDEWKTPLPDHITFDSDHGMSVATTVGSGVPRIDEGTGNLIVAGSYSSLPRAQEVRTLVNEGHIRTTSVAFMSEKSQKDGKTVATRELLNGAFVAIPSNREALVLASKAVKAGARNSKSDAEMIQSVHDNAATLGAMCAKSLKAAGAGEDVADPATLALAAEAAIDEAVTILDGVDVTTLPAEVQQALSLVQAADVAMDELLDALGVQDPDEDAAAQPAAVSPAAPAKAAAAVETAAAEADALTLTARSLATLVAGYTSSD